MANINKVQKVSSSRSCRGSSCSLQPRYVKVLKDARHKKNLKSQEKKEWKHATCSVCMEHPHNAVLLLCSSYNKGCRPYMCATGTRYSNCLKQYKKAYAKFTSTCVTDPIDTPIYDLGSDNGKTKACELLCPLCRGQVKGWTIVKPARKHLNAKRRACTQDNCLFVGSYKELKKHVRAEHPWARPREVDPSHAEKWKRLEREGEQEDVISTIRSSMPGALVIGDYVIERPQHIYSGYLGNSGGGDGYLSWDDEDVEMDHQGSVAASGDVGNNFFSRLWHNGNRALSGEFRRQRRRSSDGGR